MAWGDLDAITARVRGHFDAGADHVSIQAIDENRRGVPVDAWRELAPALTELGDAVASGPSGPGTIGARATRPTHDARR